MKTEIVHWLTEQFEAHAQKTETGVEYWLARDIQHLLGYTEWRNFTGVISKARTACEIAGHAISDHFVDVNKMVRYGMTRDLASGSGLGDHAGEVAPFRVAQQMLDVTRQPVLDAGFRFLGMCFELFGEPVDDFGLHTSPLV